MTRIIDKRAAAHRQLSELAAENKRLEEHISRLEGLANLGSATAFIAHEMNNLLTPLVNYANVALKNPADQPLTEKALTKTATHCRQAANVMASILCLVSGRIEKQHTSLRSLVNGVFDCLCRDFGKDAIEVRVEIPDGLEIWASPVQIQHVLMNLILNARDAMAGRGGVLSIAAHNDAESVRISVSDTGSGISPENLRNVFDTFFTTKSRERGEGQSGYGLGLAFCKKIVDAHGGSIVVESEPQRGTAFKITLPRQR